MNKLNPIWSGLFSRSPGPGVWLRGPDAKNQGYHQPIEMKLCMNQYSHESIPDAKSECGSFSSFGDMTPQNFPLKRGTFGYLPPENGFNFEKMSVYVQIRSFRPKIDLLFIHPSKIFTEFLFKVT